MKKRIPKSAITEKQLRRLLKRAGKEEGSVSSWATGNGIKPQAVSAFIRGVQTAGLQIPEALGYRPQVVYIPLDEDPISHMNPPRRPTKRPSSKVDHSKDPVEKRHLLKDRLKRRKRQ